MPAQTKYYRCTNRVKCDLAKTRQTIEIGGAKPFVCPLADPNCERSNLRQIDGPKKGPPVPVLVGAVAAIVVIGAGVFYAMHGGNSGGIGQSIEASLKDVWPWLGQ